MTWQSIIQIAGVRDAAEAAMLVKAGVRWLGFPLRLDVHREELTDADAAAIIRGLPRRVIPVLITYLDRANELAGRCRSLGVRVVQLHGEIAPAEIAALRKTMPGLGVIKALVVRGDNLRELTAAVHACAPFVDAFLTDTFDPATGASGATGKVHDWTLSRRLVALSSRPLILAGGLTPENVGAAIRAVRPAGVDCHSGVEDAGGAKDAQRVRGFLAAARDGFAACAEGSHSGGARL